MVLTRFFSITLACLLVFALLALGSCRRHPKAKSQAGDNLLFVSLDTTRADRLGPYGWSADTSPNLARLAEKGVLFERAYSHVPSTLPAHSSMFTGRLPVVHGVRCNGKFRLPDRERTLAEMARDAGVATGAVLGAFPLDPRFGLAQGFEFYDADFAQSAKTRARHAGRREAGRMNKPGFWIGHDFVDFERGADEVTDSAIAWLKRTAVDSQKGWFLFAHYFDAHWPYEPVSKYASRFATAYEAEIAFADEHLGRLLDFVETLPGRTLIVVTADHGEGLGDHGEMLHNRFVYDSTMHVPFIISLEGTTKSGLRRSEAVSHVDLLPTILQLTDWPREARDGEEGRNDSKSLSGRSLVPLLSDNTQDWPNREIYIETLVPALERTDGIEVRGIIHDGEQGGLKYIQTDYFGRGQSSAEAGSGARPIRRSLELYDLNGDPTELANLLVAPGNDRSGIDVNGLQERARDYFERVSRDATPPLLIDMDEGTRERLRSLGYL